MSDAWQDQKQICYMVQILKDTLMSGGPGPVQKS